MCAALEEVHGRCDHGRAFDAEPLMEWEFERGGGTMLEQMRAPLEVLRAPANRDTEPRLVDCRGQAQREPIVLFCDATAHPPIEYALRSEHVLDPRYAGATRLDLWAVVVDFVDHVWPHMIFSALRFKHPCALEGAHVRVRRIGFDAAGRLRLAVELRPLYRSDDESLALEDDDSWDPPR